MGALEVIIPMTGMTHTGTEHMGTQMFKYKTSHTHMDPVNV